MSYCLDLLLDSARRSECEANDAAMREMDMRHHEKLSRQLGAEKDSCLQQVTVTPRGEQGFSYIHPGPRAAAYMDGMEKFPGAHILVNDASWLEMSMQGAAQ
jgi:hypothetical protein